MLRLSIAFNSRTVAVIGMSRVMTRPCKVFNFTSQDIAAKGRWTPRLFLGPDLIFLTMKGINTWGGLYSKLLKQQLADDSRKKQNERQKTKSIQNPAVCFSSLFHFLVFVMLVDFFHGKT